MKWSNCSTTAKSLQGGVLSLSSSNDTIWKEIKTISKVICWSVRLNASMSCSVSPVTVQWLKQVRDKRLLNIEVIEKVLLNIFPKRLPAMKKNYYTLRDINICNIDRGINGNWTDSLIYCQRRLDNETIF